MINVVTEVTFKRQALQKSFAYHQSTKFDQSFQYEHKKIAVGLNIGGMFEGISASLGLSVQKTLDTVSASETYEDIKTGTIQSFQDGFQQIYRTVKTTIYIKGHHATTEDEVYVDVLKDEDAASLDQQQLNDMARDYIKDHFGKEIPSNEPAKFEHRFCAIGNFHYWKAT